MGVVNDDGSVKEVCPYRFTVTPENNNYDDDDANDGYNNLLYFPYCAEEELFDNAVHNDVTRIVLILHGFSRDADDYYDCAVEAKNLAETDSSTTTVIAPQFLKEIDIEHHSLDDSTIFWKNIKWNEGLGSVLSNDDSSRTRPFSVSSYSIMNQILLALNDYDMFPNLQTIVVFGHGAGSQYVQRYAAGSTVAEDMSPSLTFVVANPGTQFYLTDKRTVKGTVDQFELPDDSDCPNYNDYKYGLDNMNDYMANMGASTLMQNYVSRQVNMMLGELDNNDWPSLDKRCAGMMQGRFRRERGVIFHNALLDQFGEETVGHHGFYFVPGSGHHRDRMMQSSCGLHLLFGAGTLEESCSTTMSYSLRRFITCQGCKRNIALVAIGIAIVTLVGLFYYKRIVQKRNAEKKDPLLDARESTEGGTLV